MPNQRLKRTQSKLPEGVTAVASWMSPFAKRESVGAGMFNDVVALVAVASFLHVVSDGFSRLPKGILEWVMGGICAVAGGWALIHFLFALIQPRQMRKFKVPEQKATIADYLVDNVTQHSHVTLITKDLSWLRPDNRRLQHWLEEGNRLKIISCDPGGEENRLCEFASLRNVTVILSEHPLGPLRASRYTSAGAEFYLVGRRTDKRHYILSVNQKDEVVFHLLRDYFALLADGEVAHSDGANRA